MAMDKEIKFLRDWILQASIQISPAVELRARAWLATDAAHKLEDLTEKKVKIEAYIAKINKEEEE